MTTYNKIDKTTWTDTIFNIAIMSTAIFCSVYIFLGSI